MSWLDEHTIFLTVAGSQAHGTARESSDLDLRGVCVAPLPIRLSLFSAFEQHEGPPPEGLARLVSRERAEAECVIFDVAKFVRLCANANPNALEILFADPRDWLLDTPAWRRLYDQRHAFLSKKVQQTFLGYALAQLQRIEIHRAWLLHPPAQKPCREDFGLPADGGTLSRDDQNRIEQSIAEKLRRYGIDDIEMPRPARIALAERLAALTRDLLSASEADLEARMRAVATRGLRLPPEVVSALNAERRYRAAMKRWDSYQTWQAQRNPARAELERAHGYDTKHAMHLIRLMRMGLEALEQGDLFVRRRDADELAAIRDGAMPFEQLLASAGELRSAMERAAERTALPDDVDLERVDALATALMLDQR